MSANGGMTMSDADRNEEIARNYDFLQRNLARFMPDQAGRFALLSHQQVLGFFDDAFEAVQAGRRSASDGLYSVQEVTDRPVELGVYANSVR
jgi:hypothetical protein